MHVRYGQILSQGTAVNCISMSEMMQDLYDYFSLKKKNLFSETFITMLSFPLSFCLVFLCSMSNW